MKTLELRSDCPDFVLQLDKGPRTLKEASWREMVKAAADSPPLGPDGKALRFTPDLMRKRMKIHKAVDELPEDATELKLEDADASELVAATESMQWVRYSQWILDFCEAVEALPNGKA